MTHREEEIKKWLLPVLHKSNIKDIKLTVSKKNDLVQYYSGDIFYVQATDKDDPCLRHSFVIKISKSDPLLRAHIPVEHCFLNEIFIYKTLLPAFCRFAESRNVKDLFVNLPKYYGSVIEDNLEALVLKNLSKDGFRVWPRQDPMPLGHLESVLSEYAKFHAISVAMAQQKPKKFQKLVKGLKPVIQLYCKRQGAVTLYEKSIEEITVLLKDCVSNDVLSRWEKSIEGVISILDDIVHGTFGGLKVINHGDCWNDNYLFIGDVRPDVAVIDWQSADLLPLVYDLSHCIFCCISGENLEKIDLILRNYYKTFCALLKQLGCDPNELYPIENFLEEWQAQAKYGVMRAILVMKLISAPNDEIVDMVEIVEDNNINDVFLQKTKNLNYVKERMKPIVEYVVKHNLI